MTQEEAVLQRKEQEVTLASIRATEAKRILASEDWKRRQEELTALIYANVESFNPNDKSEKAIYLLGMLRQLVNEVTYPERALLHYETVKTELQKMRERAKQAPAVPFDEVLA